MSASQSGQLLKVFYTIVIGVLGNCMNDGEVDTTKTKTNRVRAVFGLEHSHKLQRSCL